MYKNTVYANANENYKGAIKLAKAGMKRPGKEQNISTESNERQHYKKNDVEPVPEIQGKAKHGNKKAGMI